ncbi:MAG: DNA primase [Flavobacteriales bacterium]|jgi:DNA primase|uniref:DNA primase n=1 Tax=Blattabacterium sp. (Mastotermes darwiniensis) TaxID=39768 RepID=UPI000231DF7B|nr:DNA primase [Blattabacterium sp. (Mastotermes darwiniensis)]AER40403.1 DNA primase [Blattabacterium sp. (Mastotermes darwiniensis) str. MADAR]MDR1804876.1 DNA primase [Flavobacteriales bacterium]
MISKETIKRIFSASCIEEVIGDFVSLKKSGLNYRGLSPFSNEKTPSLIVSPTKKIWKDFSSGKGGNIITFLMEHENFSYVESLHYLAKKYDIKIHEYEVNSTIRKINHDQNLYLIQDYAKCFFIEQLHFTKEGKEKGLNYLMKQRNFDITTIHKFELGYAPYSCNSFTKKALKKGFQIRDLKKSGLTGFKQSNNFDCFRQRVIFPIHNLSGIVLGFGGRSISSYSRSTKYLNSSENDIFQKSKILYGFFQAKTTILKENLCYLVEGYADVLSLHQSGIKNVVSSSGTSLTIDQILLIKKFTKNIILFYDGDISGIRASLRGINMILEQEINLRLVFIHNGEDPDILSKKYSSSQLRDFLVNNSYNFVSFKQKIYEKFHQDDPIKKSFLVWNILNSISKISNLIQRELYLQEASKKLKIRQEILIYELGKISKKTFYNKEKKISLEKKNINYLLILEKKLIQLILFYGDKIIKKEGYYTTVYEEIFHTFQCHNLRFSLNYHQKIFDKIWLQKKTIEKCKFFEKKKKLYSLSQWNRKGIEVPSKNANIDRYLMDLLLRYKSQYFLKLIQQEINNFKKNREDNKFFIKKIMHLTSLKNEINKKLHRYV